MYQVYKKTICVFIAFFFIALLFVRTGFAWIPPAELEFSCAEGAGIDWPNFPMGGALKATPEDCKKMLVTDFRVQVNPMNTSKGLCIAPDITDDEIYQSMLHFYETAYKDNKTATYMTVVNDFIWQTFACTEQDRIDHAHSLEKTFQRNEFLNNAEMDFNGMAYHSDQSGKTFCPPLSKGTDFFEFLKKHSVNTAEEWKKLDLNALLIQDYPCPAVSHP